jgi:hypothetical protein
MKQSKAIALIICVVFLLAGFAVSSEGQVSTKMPSKVSKKPIPPPTFDYNVSGKIGWQEYKFLAKKCGDLRVVISEQKGTTDTGGLQLPKYEIVGYQYPTTSSNPNLCDYRVKLPVGKPMFLGVEWTGHFLQPVGSTVVKSDTVGWQNPITVKPGQKLIRNFKIVVTEIH